MYLTMLFQLTLNTLNSHILFILSVVFDVSQQLNTYFYLFHILMYAFSVLNTSLFLIFNQHRCD